MGDVVVSLLPLIAGAGLVPVYVIMVVLLLGRPDGVGVAVAMVTGMTAVRLLQGGIFGFVFEGVGTSDGTDEPGIIASVLLLVLGLLMWTAAVKQLLEGEDPDAPPPKWLTALDTISPLTALGIGAGLVAIAAKQWVFMLGALGIVRDSDLGRTEAIVAYLIFVLGAELLLLLPILYRVVAREQAAAVLGGFGTWLEEHNRSIVIVVSIVFGTLFLWKGITGLAG